MTRLNLGFAMLALAALAHGACGGETNPRNGPTGPGSTTSSGPTTTAGGSGGTGGMGGSASVGGGSGVGGNMTDCGECVLDAVGDECETQIDDCEDDAGCGNYAMCVQSCISGDDTAGCYATCESSFGAGTTLWQPAATCICAECTASCPALCTP
jgi:hypothetical protein